MKTEKRNKNVPAGDTENVPGYVRRLRRLRTDAGLTQQQVASQIGSSRSNYIRYERGRTDLPTRHLLSLCLLYGVSSDHVLGIGSDAEATDASAAPEASAETATLEAEAVLTLAADQPQYFIRMKERAQSRQYPQRK